MRKSFYALCMVLALLFAPFAMADPTDVGFAVAASADHQSMSDAKACMACHVAPEQKQQETFNYKVKAKHLPNNDGIGGGSSNASAFKMRNPYTEVGWRQ